MYQQGVVIRKKASGQDKSMYLLSKYSNVLLGNSLNLNSHSSEIRYLCLKKCCNETLSIEIRKPTYFFLPDKCH